MPANTPLQRAREREAEVVAAIKSVCGVSYTLHFVQADPTGGIERPVVADKPDTIDKIVEKDPFAAVDLSETVAVTDAIDPLVEALQSKFPDGSFSSDDSSSPEQ
jgi:hypothetical protein